MSLSKILELRKKIKSKKPVFIRQNYEKRKRLHHKVWRKPKGLHSKMRHHIRGRRKSPSVGYKSPVEAKGLHPSGMKQAVVHNLSEMPPSNEYGIIISGNVGKRKKSRSKISKIIKHTEGKKPKSEEAEKKKEKHADMEKPAKDSEDKKKEEEKKEKDKLLIKKV